MKQRIRERNERHETDRNEQFNHVGEERN